MTEIPKPNPSPLWISESCCSLSLVSKVSLLDVLTVLTRTCLPSAYASSRTSPGRGGPPGRAVEMLNAFPLHPDRIDNMLSFPLCQAPKEEFYGLPLPSAASLHPRYLTPGQFPPTGWPIYSEKHISQSAHTWMDGYTVTSRFTRLSFHR